MSNQRSQLEATFLSRLQPKETPAVTLPEQGELAGRRRDPSLFSLSLHRIRPDEDQVRRSGKSETDPLVIELAASIRAVGILQPLDVRYLRESDCYEIVAGERRYTAAKLAGLQEVPVKLLDATEAEVRRLQILENIHREQLSPLDLGTALLELTAGGATPDDLAKLLSKSKSFVTKALGVGRNLSDAAKQTVQSDPGRFQSMAHLYEVSLLPPTEQQSLLVKIADERLTREQLQALTAEKKHQANPARPSKGGRPVHARQFSKTIEVDDATVTIRFPKANATREQLREVLRKALESLA